MVSLITPSIQPNYISFASPIEEKSANTPNTNYYFITKEKMSVSQRIVKIVKGLGLFIITFGFGLGLGLLSPTLRNKISVWYEECRTGYTHVRHLKTSQFPDSIVDQIKLVQTIPDDEINTVAKYLDTGRKKLTLLTVAQLENGLMKALKEASKLSPEEKTTLWTMAERLALCYLKKGENKKAFETRIKAVQMIPPAAPFANFHHNLHKAHPKLGLCLQPLDSSLFKNQTLTIQKRNYGNNNYQIHAFTKLGHTARSRIKSTIESIQNQPEEFFKILPTGFCKKITVTDEGCVYHARSSLGSKQWEGNFSTNQGCFTVYGFGSKEVKVIHFEGIGKIKIGNEPSLRAEYNRISIELDSNIPDSQAAQKLNILFAAIGLGGVSSTSRPEDIERVKVLQLFRAYYPKEAYQFEREPASFEESVESLKSRIEWIAPDMKKRFKYYFEDHPEKIYKQEVYPGQYIWAIDGLANETRNAGAIGLMAGVGIHGEKHTTTINKIISILKLGALSTQDRFQAGITASGASSDADLRTGGGEYVFTRMITKSMHSISDFPLQGNMQILYDLDLVERVGYGYTSDKYGTKDPSSYQNRSNIVKLAQDIQGGTLGCYTGNEVCIRNRIPPHFVRGVKVNELMHKQALISALQSEGLTKKNASGIETINEIPLDKFVTVDKCFKEIHWN